MIITSSWWAGCAYGFTAGTQSLTTAGTLSLQINKSLAQDAAHSWMQAAGSPVRPACEDMASTSTGGSQ